MVIKISAALIQRAAELGEQAKRDAIRDGKSLADAERIGKHAENGMLSASVRGPAMAATGAVIGSAIVPVLGTIVGGVIGYFCGAVSAVEEPGMGGDVKTIMNLPPSDQ